MMAIIAPTRESKLNVLYIDAHTRLIQIEMTECEDQESADFMSLIIKNPEDYKVSYL
jgi:hypothetical protein